MKINPGNARGLLVPQGDRPFSFVVYSSEIRDFGIQAKASKVGQPCGIAFVGFALVRTAIKEARIDEDWMQISFFEVAKRRLPENAGAFHKNQVGIL